MKVSIKLPKPRNPLAVLARQRKAGGHQRNEQSRRELKQQLRRQLAREE
ncbi:hypothetical protein [Massilia sp. BJB1822]|nr:hypothetical protein [Massilia sp. BJB1822]NVD96495.1 hypothetical protein [Massilia sp. BJB1822]